MSRRFVLGKPSAIFSPTTISNSGAELIDHDVRRRGQSEQLLQYTSHVIPPHVFMWSAQPRSNKKCSGGSEIPNNFSPVVRDMLSATCEALAGFSSNQTQNSLLLRSSPHLSWKCANADTAVEYTRSATPSSSCYGSSDCSTSNSNVNSPSNEAPASTIWKE